MADRYLNVVFHQRGILPPIGTNPFLLTDLATGNLFVLRKGTFMVLLKTLKLGVACTYSLAFRVFGARAPETPGWLKGRWAEEDVITELLLAVIQFGHR